MAQAAQLAAARQEGNHKASTDWDVGDTGTHFLDDAGGFVAEQHRHRAHPAAVHHRQVGVAQPGRFDAHEKLPVAGRRQVELTDGERPRFGVGAGETDLLEHSAADPHDYQPAVTGRLLP